VGGSESIDRREVWMLAGAEETKHHILDGRALDSPRRKIPVAYAYADKINETIITGEYERSPRAPLACIGRSTAARSRSRTRSSTKYARCPAANQSRGDGGSRYGWSGANGRYVFTPRSDQTRTDLSIRNRPSTRSRLLDQLPQGELAIVSDALRGIEQHGARGGIGGNQLDVR